MAKILLLGGTRNLGHVTALSLLREGHTVTVLTRGLTRDELPREVERLRATRGHSQGMQSAVGNRAWDVVIDTTSYTGDDARELLDMFAERCGRIIFVSTGQVYLVRTGALAPFRESDYDGAVMSAPPAATGDYNDWLYGINKRDAEDMLRASARPDFPIVSLRMPMIASERDHYARIQGYSARVMDGGPILVPEKGSLPIRHLYVEDAAAIIAHLCIDRREGAAQYNISTGDSHSLQSFFDMLGGALGRDVETVAVSRDLLESQALLPACSPYSGRWMSELDNTLGLSEAVPPGFSYTGLSSYLPRVVADYMDRWIPTGVQPAGYERRSEELAIAKKSR